MPDGISFIMVSNYSYKTLTINLIKKFSSFGIFTFTSVGGRVSRINDNVGRVGLYFFDQYLIIAIPVARAEMKVG